MTSLTDDLLLMLSFPNRCLEKNLSSCSDMRKRKVLSCLCCRPRELLPSFPAEVVRRIRAARTRRIRRRLMSRPSKSSEVVSRPLQSTQSKIKTNERAVIKTSNCFTAIKINKMFLLCFTRSLECFETIMRNEIKNMNGCHKL